MIFTQVIQGVLGSMMTICAFSCVLLMPLGDALTLIFSAPVSTMVVAAVILRHRLRLYKLSFGLVLLIGTVLVVRPPFLFGDASMVHFLESFLLVLIITKTCFSGACECRQSE